MSIQQVLLRSSFPVNLLSTIFLQEFRPIHQRSFCLRVSPELLYRVTFRVFSVQISDSANYFLLQILPRGFQSFLPSYHLSQRPYQASSRQNLFPRFIFQAEFLWPRHYDIPKFVLFPIVEEGEKIQLTRAKSVCPLQSLTFFLLTN